MAYLLTLSLINLKSHCISSLSMYRLEAMLFTLFREVIEGIYTCESTKKLGVKGTTLKVLKVSEDIDKVKKKVKIIEDLSKRN